MSDEARSAAAGDLSKWAGRIPALRAALSQAFPFVAAALVFGIALAFSWKDAGGTDKIRIYVALMFGGLASLIHVRLRADAGAGVKTPADESEGEPALIRCTGPQKTVFGSSTWIQTLALVLLCVFSTLNYYRFDAARFTTVHNHYDVTYYYLNSKYFEELGYEDLYLGLLIADQDNRRRLDHITQLRDMESYQLVKRRSAVREHQTRVRAQFSDERWENFKRDSDWFLQRQSKSSLDYFFKDHGYNPPPTWTLVGKTLSSAVSVEHLKWITMVDFGLVLTMFGLLFWAFGPEVMLLSWLFMTFTTSGSWPVVGQALLRFDWLAAIVGALCFLKKKHHGVAGALLAYATMSRIFPAVFFFPYLVAALVKVVKTKKIPRSVLRFAGAAALVTTVQVGGALASFGPEAFVASKKTMDLHAGTKSYSSLRVGLGDAFIFRGERSRAELRPGGIPAKEKKLEALQPMIKTMAAVLLAFLSWCIVRRRGPLHEALPLAYFPFFFLTTPQINYHNVRLVLVAWHASKLRSLPHLIALLLLGGGEVFALLTSVNGAIAYTRTSTLSVGLTVYSAFVLAWLGYDAARHSLSQSLPARE